MGWGTTAAPRDVGEMPDAPALGHSILHQGHRGGMLGLLWARGWECWWSPHVPASGGNKGKAKAFLKTSLHFNSSLFKDT